MAKYVFVWEDTPGEIEEGFIPLVKLADGNSTKAGDFDFAENFAQWLTKYPEAGAWIYLYGSDTVDQISGIVAEHVTTPTIIVLDIEESVGANVVSPLVAKLHELGHKVWLSTFGLLGQAQTRNIPFNGMGFDVFSPQVYYPYQADGVNQWSNHGALVIPTYSPGDWEGLELPEDDYALWRYPQYGSANSNAPATPDNSASAGTDSKDVDMTAIPQIKEGAGSNGRNQTVANAQALLDAHGAHLNIDGNFGPLTDAAVREFQTSQGIGVDGIIGPITWNKLLTT